MKFCESIVVQKPLEDVFAWMSQPEHLADLLMIDPVKQRNRNDPNYPSSELSEHFHTSMYPFDASELRIEGADTLAVGARLRYTVRLKRRISRDLDHTWVNYPPLSVTITAYQPPHTLTFKSIFIAHHLTFAAQQESTMIRYVASFPFGLLEISNFVFRGGDETIANSHTEMVRRLSYIKALMENEAEKPTH